MHTSGHTHSIPCRRRRQLGVFLLGAGLQPGAWALLGGSGPQRPDPTAPWAGVGSLDNGRGGLFTATPLDARHVITAAHVVAGGDVQRLRFRLVGGQGFVSGATALHVHPAFRGMKAHNPPSDPTAHHDLAIVRLADPLPDAVPIPPVFTGELARRTITLVSHGGSATHITLGENVVDVTFPDEAGRPATFLFDFDGPDLSSNRFGPALSGHGSLGPRREAGLTGGDSGSAVFVYADGAWWLAGINGFRLTFGPNPPADGYGTAGGGVVLSTHLDWIRSVLGQG